MPNTPQFLHLKNHTFFTKSSKIPPFNPLFYQKSKLYKPHKKFLKMSYSSTSQQQQNINEELQRSNLLQPLIYHQQTKHNFTNYAKGPGRLDWANQPNPFRRYISSPLINLQHFPTCQEKSFIQVGSEKSRMNADIGNPLCSNNSNETHGSEKSRMNVDLGDPLCSNNNSETHGLGKSRMDAHLGDPLYCSNEVGSEKSKMYADLAVDPLYYSVFNSFAPPKPICFSTISQFFYDSLALSAWKTTGFSTWSLRVNPSSGNLHPTEAYLIAPAIESISNSSFVAHYAPKEHGLEIRTEIGSEFFDGCLPRGCFLVGLTSIFWREAWKYGERAFRYCNHDVGHAIGAIAMAASGLGWDVKLLDGLGFDELEKLMGVENEPKLSIPSRPVKGEFKEIEFEHPDCVLAVFPLGEGEGFEVDYEGLRGRMLEFSKLDWKGKPNMLSKEHVVWDVIYRTSEAVKKPMLEGEKLMIDPFQGSGVCSESWYKGLTLREVVRKRRSAVDMDGVTSIDRNAFYQMLMHCLPSGMRNGEKQGKQLALPFRALDWDSEVHAALFVHRVSGLPKGLYFLVRNENHFDDLKKSLRLEFTWRKPEGCPGNLPLYELARGDCKEISKRLSCHQDIASDGCFSLGMIAHFKPTLLAKGAWMYPRPFWETGVLGQLLYLEAHAMGISATGIGCFFDDPVHELLGLNLKESNYQSLYHFTVGGPVVDKRIMSLPAYPGPEMDA